MFDMIGHTFAQKTSVKIQIMVKTLDLKKADLVFLRVLQISL
jgi:hypothetical protein